MPTASAMSLLEVALYPFLRNKRAAQLLITSFLDCVLFFYWEMYISSWTLGGNVGERFMVFGRNEGCFGESGAVKMCKYRYCFYLCGFYF